tara:strand:- start:257 stop:967 length:711 start_codon:yes stop_codon:yes gene_type:complete
MGSRAFEVNGEDSDWDLMLVWKREVDLKNRHQLIRNLLGEGEWLPTRNLDENTGRTIYFDKLGGDNFSADFYSYTEEDVRKRLDEVSKGQSTNIRSHTAMSALSVKPALFGELVFPSREEILAMYDDRLQRAMWSHWWPLYPAQDFRRISLKRHTPIRLGIAAQKIHILMRLVFALNRVFVNSGKQMVVQWDLLDWRPEGYPDDWDQFFLQDGEKLQSDFVKIMESIREKAGDIVG